MIRSDAADKAEGALSYGADLAAEGMLWAALVLAPGGHARLHPIDLAPVRRRPGVVAAIGPAEAAALLPKGGDPDRPIFPSTEVQYHGQPVAAVAAESRVAAEAAARSVRVVADPLPPRLDPLALFPDWPEGLRERPEVIAHVRAHAGSFADEVARADWVAEETYRTSGIAQVALEPHACLAEVRDGEWRVRASTQSPFGLRSDLAELLGVPEASVRVEGSWVGGGFGGKAAPLVEPYALLLAAATGRPVKLSLTYPEEFRLGRSTLPAFFHLTTTVREGRMTARRVRLLLDSGASLPGRDFATGYAIGFLLGPYRYDAFEVEGFAVQTHKPPFGPHRAPLAPQCAFAAESHVDGIARRLGEDPIAFRLRHVWHEGDRTMFGQTVGPTGLSEGLERAAATARAWRASGRDGHGIGVAVGFWSTSVGAGGEARVRLRPDRLVIEVGEREIGSGSIVRGLPAVAERVLGIPPDRVEVAYGPTSEAPFDSGVFGSRTVGALGQAVEKAAGAVRSALAERLGAPAGTLRIEAAPEGLRASAGGRVAPVVELLSASERADGGLVRLGRHYGGGSGLDASVVDLGEFYPYSDFTAAVHLAEVEVDRATGRVRPVRCAAFQDVGVVLDPEMFRGQVEGAVAMGLGEALTEETVIGPDGRVTNAQLLDYRIPTLAEVPPIEVVAIEGHPGAGPFGAKGIGEPPIIPVPAAVANAVADATGARLSELPMTPERVARALKPPS